MVGGSLGVLRLLSQLKTGRHDTAEIWLKVALSTKKSFKIKINTTELKDMEFNKYQPLNIRVVNTIFDIYVCIMPIFKK
jgi:hypothetical protein